MTFFPEKLTFTWLKSSYATGAVTPAEVVEEIIKRAQKYKEYHVWIVEPDMKWIGKYLDDLLQRQEKSHPLWGIPFAVKDNIDLENIPTTAGCKEYAYIPGESATVVQKLIAAGAIPIGKANLDQFATGLVGTRSPYGEVHNALNPDLISGGSSSGSAVAVALGMAAFSLGTDTAGSGRVPAALNNLIGYKPSLGAWSTKGVVPACASLDCVTVFANGLEEVEAVNKAARGFDEDCCWSREYALPEEVLPAKIYLPKDQLEFYGPYAKTYVSKWNQAVKRLEGLGMEVEYIDYTMFQNAASILYDGPWVAERWKDLGEFVEKNPGKVFPVTEKILRSGNKPDFTAASVFKAMHQLQEYRLAARKLLKDAVLVMPTAGGTFTREEVRENPIATNSQMGLYTNHCNLLDLCAVAIPTESGCKSEPFGITLFSLAESENLILGAAKAFLCAETMKVAVCGLHKKGYPLESQLIELGGRFLERTTTAPCYNLYELQTDPVKPGMKRAEEGGEAIEVDVYAIPVKQFGVFMRKVAPPLCMGTLLLADGEPVTGFLCEDYALLTAKDITFKRKFTC